MLEQYEKLYDFVRACCKCNEWREKDDLLLDGEEIAFDEGQVDFADFLIRFIRSGNFDA